MINPFDFIKNLESLKTQAEEMKKKLPTIRATGYAMGNMIEVVATGEFKIESIKIDPSLIKDGNNQMLEVLTASAINNALENIKTRIGQETGQLGQLFGYNL